MATKQPNPLQAVTAAAAAVFPGLKNFGPEVAAEIKREATQASMEIASLLFSGSAFVQYGPGQHTPEPDHTQDATPQQQQEREGMER